MEMNDLSCAQFLAQLASKAPTPGGGGTAALVGAAGVALGNMVGCLTVGKKKYAAVEADILTLNERAGALRAELEALVQADAEAFAPLAAAYGLPKDTPEQAAHKAAVLETALDAACAVPLEIMGKCAEGIALVEEYAARGSALAVSDAGCAAALCRALRALGRTAYLLENPEITETYTPYAEGLWAPKGFVPGAVVSVDIAAPNLLPENAVPYKNDICLAIDHHGSQEFFAERTCLDAEAAACGEIVYEIVGRLTDITPEIAMALYVAVSTDCGCFVYANTTARTHRIAAALMERGIDVGPVNKALFRTKSPVRLAMEARMVADMELYDNGRVVVMSIPLALCRELGAAESDVEELSSLAALVQGTDCGITLRELKPGRVKLSLRTGPRVDASAVCRVLGGGGHRGAAGATVDGTMDEAKAAILAAYTEVMG